MSNSKIKASFVQQNDGTYKLFIGGKLEGILTEEQALARVDQLKYDDSWVLNWKYHVPSF